MSDKDKAAPVGEREAFEVWLGIRPCGAAHDLAREAFKAGAAYQRAQQPQSAEAVAYVTGYHGGRCIIEPLNRAAVLPTGMALYSHPQPSAGVVMPARKDESKYRGTGLIATRQWNACLDEFARLNKGAGSHE